MTYGINKIFFFFQNQKEYKEKQNKEKSDSLFIN